MGFKEVYNVSGGIKNWLYPTLSGPATAGLELLDPEADFKDSVCLAYSLEIGLRDFYQQLAKNTERDLQEIYMRLAGFEERHMTRLDKVYRDIYGEELSLSQHPRLVRDSVEGGFELSDLHRSASDIVSIPGAFEFAIMIETQSFDLYRRMAGKTDQEKIMRLFFDLADEEKMHLKYIELESNKLSL